MREHGRNPNPTEVGRRKFVGRVDTGKVYIQPVEIPAEPPGEKPMRLRRIEVYPKRLLDAKRVAEIYRKRWSMEGLFQRLEASLHSEVRSLGIPAAALLAFCTAVVSFNALSVVQAAIEQAHPICAQHPLSTFYVATELRCTFDGLRIAVPPEYWSEHDLQSPAQMAQTLPEVAARVDPAKLRKHPRSTRKEKKPKGYAPASEVRRHIATTRVRAAGTVDYDSG